MKPTPEQTTELLARWRKIGVTQIKYEGQAIALYFNSVFGCWEWKQGQTQHAVAIPEMYALAVITRAKLAELAKIINERGYDLIVCVPATGQVQVWWEDESSPSIYEADTLDAAVLDAFVHGEAERKEADDAK